MNIKEIPTTATINATALGIYNIKINKKCPFSTSLDSNDPIPTIKPSSTNISKLLSTIKFYCCYRSNGCTSELAAEEINDHEKNCKYKLFCEILIEIYIELFLITENKKYIEKYRPRIKML